MEAIIYIRVTRQNCIMNLTDLKGNTLAWQSSGSTGFSNSRRSTSYAADRCTQALIRKARKLRISRINIYIKGIGSGRRPSLQRLKTSGLKIQKLIDQTPICYNGCRPPKKRRL